MTARAPKIVGDATLDDLLAIEEEERRRHELIDGVIEPRGATSGEHGASQQRLAAHINPFGLRRSGPGPGGWWFGTEVDIYFDPKNTPRPDVAGWRRDRVPERPRGAVIKVRPDWVCEILSTNRRNDLIKKKRVYHRHQVPHYWILDPDEATLTVYRWTPDGYLEVLSAERGETVHPEPFAEIPLQVGVLFGDDPDGEPEPAP